MKKDSYRYLASSPEGVVQLIAASYLRHGYYWYVTGRIPEGKLADAIDRKLIEKYQIDISVWRRSQRRKSGLANAQYLRYDDWFILLVTSGHHQIKQPSEQGGEAESLQDCRRVPIKFAGYSISYRRSGVREEGVREVKWHAHVAIERTQYRYLKSHFEHLATHRSLENLKAEFFAVPFARYAPVRRQLLHIQRAVNKRRLAHGYDPVPHTALNLSRRPVKVFVTQPESQDSPGAEEPGAKPRP